MKSCGQTKLVVTPCAEIMTSTVDIKDDSRGRPVQKAKVKYMKMC